MAKLRPCLLIHASQTFPTEPSLAGAHTLPHSNAAVPALSAPIPVVAMTLCMPSRSSYQKK